MMEHLNEIQRIYQQVIGRIRQEIDHSPERIHVPTEGNPAIEKYVKAGCGTRDVETGAVFLGTAGSGVRFFADRNLAENWAVYRLHLRAPFKEIQIDPEREAEAVSEPKPEPEAPKPKPKSKKRPAKKKVKKGRA